ncbi:MAG: polyamine aminopropyltransferase [Fibrobacter sp.]|nr:polyamine aminopropyltransferase [Fibrobacter sp.]
MSLNFHPDSGSSLWIQNLIHGLSGLTIRAKHPVYCNSSPFQKIEVFDTYSFGLILCLGGSIVMTEHDSDTYHEMIVHPPMLMHTSPQKICIIGGGDGGCLREVLKHDTVKSVVIVDIDKMVKETVERYFPLQAEGFKDNRTNFIYDDGYHYLKTCEEKFDIIIVDSYDPAGPVQSLESHDFHRVVSMCLSPNGIAVFQTDSPITRGNFLTNTFQSVTPFFEEKRAYICSMRSFPEGICSFLACGAKSDLENFDQKRYETIAEQCTYYNSDIHTGAFLLPQYVKLLLR